MLMPLSRVAAGALAVAVPRQPLLNTVAATAGALRRTTPRAAVKGSFAHHQTQSRTNSTMSSQQIIVNTDKAPAAIGPYSQAIKTPFAIFTSGSIPLTPEGDLVEGTIAEKTRQSCKNLQAVLEEAGSSISKVVKTTVFISDMKHFPEVNEEYEKWFSHKPARSCVAAKQLPKNVDVEIECVALP